MEAEAFLRQLPQNKNIPPFLLLLGEEDYYADKALAGIKSQWLGAAAGDGCVSVLDEDPLPGLLRELIDNLPFFSERTLIVIKNSKILAAGKGGAGDKDGYVKVFSDIPPHCRVVLQCAKADRRTKLFKTLAALGAVVECEKIKAWKVADWLAQAARENGCRWEAAALELIAGYTAMAESISLRLLAQEVEKIALYAGARKIWTAADVENVFSGLPELSGFALAEAMTAGDAAKALTILREQTARGVHVLQLLGLLGHQMRRVWRAQGIIERGGGKDEVAAALRMPVFFAGDFTRRCRIIPEKKTRGAFAALAEISREVRLGGRGLERLEEMIIDFCAFQSTTPYPFSV